MERGKIYKVDKRELNIDGYDHYFVFLEDHNDYLFHGIMLTHSSDYGNIEMREEHFKTHTDERIPYTFQFENTCFVDSKLIKDSALPIEGPWGELTEEGLDFIEDNLTNTEVKTWVEAKAEALAAGI